ncbi:hypothetical protein EXN22_17450 [Pseudomonas tructae]|uniref:Uncharacterized protein n=1 Tax=Pseudomonas tructae TaxID=2518644 RepID=A0A411MKN2_9PSED|nr:hypothetical protein [Pseudomonas tructae]QBF27386.1 hypothetical protein EXN22_17450 [Pseudomonas tructae]
MAQLDAFIAWMSANLDNATFAHQYLDRKNRKPWHCSSLFNAYETYDWPHPAIEHLDIDKGRNITSNARALTALQQQLQRALAPAPEDHAASRAAIDVMIWGGVRKGNINWLIDHRKNLANLLIDTRNAIDSGELNHPLLLDPNLRFNAGMTKVYSLICKQLVIYDSRVAAALGWAVVKFCQQAEPALTQVPPELAFPWAAARPTRQPKQRNPSQGNLQFPPLQAGTVHAQWNIQASQILAAVLAHANAKDSGFNQDGGSGSSPLRRLEAALFMIGYDLGGASTTIANQDVISDWIECWTPTKHNPFHYRLTEQGFETRTTRITRFPLQVVNDTLNYLWRQFGRGQFPLANSADRVPAGLSEEGIGTAYYHAINRQQRVPESSQLTAILEDLGVFQLMSLRKKHWVLNLQLLDTPDKGSLDIEPLLLRLLDDEAQD